MFRPTGHLQWTQSIKPHRTSWRSILLLSSHLRLSSKWPLSLRFPHQNPVYTSPLPIRATYPTHPIILDFTTRTILGEKYRSLSSSLYSFSPLPCYLVPLRPKCCPQYPILEHPQPTFPKKNTPLYKVTFYFLIFYYNILQHTKLKLSFIYIILYVLYYIIRFILYYTFYIILYYIILYYIILYSWG